MKVTYVDHMGSDLSVVNAARVSFGKKSDWVCPDCGKPIDECFEIRSSKCDITKDGVLSEKDTKLIKYLARENHKSPFNHTYMTCHVKAPIFVARQLVKHKFMPWNEISRRYVDSEPEFYFPEVWRSKSLDKKQGSGKALTTSEDLEYQLKYDTQMSLDSYRRILTQGVAPEQARMVLPLNTYTEWYWSGTLGAWMDMYNLRIKEDTQEETRLIAKEAGEIIKEYFPVSFEALRSD